MKSPPPAVLFLEPGVTGDFELPVGEAKLSIRDHWIVWDHWQMNWSSQQAETLSVEVTPATTATVQIDRTPDDLRAVADFEWPTSTGSALFYWPAAGDQTTPTFSGFPNTLTRDQAAIIRVLLRAYADGQPEVPEQELLERAGLEDRTFTELFPPETRKLLGYLIAGQDEGTWRLAPLPEGYLNRPEGANEPAEPADAADADEEPPMPMDNAA